MAAGISGSDVAQMLADVQLKEGLRTYNHTVELAFRRCVSNFRGNKLTEDEKECAVKTTSKLLQHSFRVKARIQDIQSAQQAEMQKKMREIEATREASLPTV